MNKQANLNHAVKLLLLTALVVGITSCSYLRPASSPSHSASSRTRSDSSTSNSSSSDSSSPSTAASPPPPQSAPSPSQSASTPTIVGKWAYRDGSKATLEFKKDGAFVQNQDDEIYNGTYILQGDNKFKLSYPDTFDSAEFDITAVDADNDRINLTWKNGDLSVLFRSKSGDYKESESPNRNSGGGTLAGDIIGTWQMEEDATLRLTFGKDGGFTATGGASGGKGTYTVSETANSIEVKSSKGKTDQLKILKIGGDKLSLEKDGDPANFKRVN